MWPLQSGDHIDIFLEAPNAANLEMIEEDFMSLMQQGPAQATCCCNSTAQTGCVFNVHAQPFVPDHPDIATMPETIQDLHAL